LVILVVAGRVDLDHQCRDEEQNERIRKHNAKDRVISLQRLHEGKDEAEEDGDEESNDRRRRGIPGDDANDRCLFQTGARIQIKMETIQCHACLTAKLTRLNLRKHSGTSK